MSTETKGIEGGVKIASTTDELKSETSLNACDKKVDAQKGKISSNKKANEKALKRAQELSFDESFSLLDKIDTKQLSIESLLILMSQNILQGQVQMWIVLRDLVKAATIEREKAMKNQEKSHTSLNMWMTHGFNVAAAVVPLALLGYDSEGFKDTAQFYGQGARAAGGFTQSFNSQEIDVARMNEKVISEEYQDLKQQLEQIIAREFDKVIQTLAQMQQIRLQSMR